MRRGGDLPGREAGERGLIIDDQRAGFCRGDQHLLKGGFQRCVLFIDFAQCGLVRVRKICAGVDELPVIDLEEFTRFGIETFLCTAAVDGLDAGEQFGV